MISVIEKNMNTLKTDKTILTALAVVLCALVLASCGGTTPVKADKNPVAERSQARWDMLLAGDYAGAYEYLSPGFRSGTSLTDFEMSMRLRKVRYEQIQYQSHECQESVCTVKLEANYLVGAPVPGLKEYRGSSVIEEQWINTGSEWWYLPAPKD